MDYNNRYHNYAFTVLIKIFVYFSYYTYIHMHQYLYNRAPGSVLSHTKLVKLLQLSSCLNGDMLAMSTWIAMHTLLFLTFVCVCVCVCVYVGMRSCMHVCVAYML